MHLDELQLAVVGLGYVGLPLAAAFARHRSVLGFDISRHRVDEINAGRDATLEVTPEVLRAARGLRCSLDPRELRRCNTFIVAVPTPVDHHNRPDLGPLIQASETVGRALKPGDLVIYESTVYPGCTEEDCVPVLERTSGLRFNHDFCCGYSPERVSPGDRQRPIESIVKVTSGSTPEAAERVDALYREIITAGTHRAESIRVAEAAKVIENTQRDINIALVNELAQIFSRMGIDTESVLRAARSKWNFIPFAPGLVGGHCIGVDPYYLTHKAQAMGYEPALILAGRRVNDGMGRHVADRLVQVMSERHIRTDGARVLVMGLTFKENCPDLRNTRVADIVTSLQAQGCRVDVLDPWACRQVAASRHGIALVEQAEPGVYDAIVLAVAHREFSEMGPAAIRRLGRPGAIIFDLKYVLPADAADLRL